VPELYLPRHLVPPTRCAPAGVPVGTVVAFAGRVQPLDGTGGRSDTSPQVLLEAQGWTVCDGRKLQVTRYPELFGVLGYLYGGEKGEFFLPDYRGLFLRGVDAGSGRDPDARQRTPAAGGTAEEVGSTQEDGLQEHQHKYGATQAAAVSQEGEAAGTVVTTPETQGPTSPPARVSQETRPKNIYVSYIIRYR
jgi:microcystin-dependent protein